MAEYLKSTERKKYLEKNDIVRATKKFVFQISPENIDYVESLSYQEKQDLINFLITQHRDNEYYEYTAEQDSSKVKKIIITTIAIIIGIPVLLLIINLSLNLTKASYLDMQRNFEVLYQNKQ